MPAHGSTTQRGYGTTHQRAAKELHRTHIEGTPCRRCHQPMYTDQGLDAGHPPGADPRLDPPDALEHATCNRAGGGRTSAHRRGGGSQFIQSRAWIGMGDAF